MNKEDISKYYMTKSIESIENDYSTGFGKSLNGRRDWGIKLFIFQILLVF